MEYGNFDRVKSSYVFCFGHNVVASDTRSSVNRNTPEFTEHLLCNAYIHTRSIQFSFIKRTRIRPHKLIKLYSQWKMHFENKTVGGGGSSENRKCFIKIIRN